MALETFEPIVVPSPGAAHSRSLKILETEFGDGYSQPQPAGLNHIRRAVALKWDALSAFQMRSIVGFFDDHGGTTPFYYQPFGYTSARQWTCKEYGAVAESGYWTVSATLKQDFSLPE